MIAMFKDFDTYIIDGVPEEEKNADVMACFDHHKFIERKSSKRSEKLFFENLTKAQHFI